MRAGQKYVYLVEGQDEKSIIRMLISEYKCIKPGKIHVINVVQEKINKARAATWGDNVYICCVFDTDVRDPGQLLANRNFLLSLSNIRDVILIPQVLNLEDELVRASMVRNAKEITKSSTDAEYKHALIKIDNLKRLFDAAEFDFSKFWVTEPRGNFENIDNESSKIRL